MKTFDEAVHAVVESAQMSENLNGLGRERFEIRGYRQFIEATALRLLAMVAREELDETLLLATLCEQLHRMFGVAVLVGIEMEKP